MAVGVPGLRVRGRPRVDGVATAAGCLSRLRTRRNHNTSHVPPQRPPWSSASTKFMGADTDSAQSLWLRALRQVLDLPRRPLQLVCSPAGFCKSDTWFPTTPNADQTPPAGPMLGASLPCGALPNMCLHPRSQAAMGPRRSSPWGGVSGGSRPAPTAGAPRGRGGGAAVPSRQLWGPGCVGKGGPARFPAGRSATTDNAAQVCARRLPVAINARKWRDRRPKQQRIASRRTLPHPKALLGQSHKRTPRNTS